MTLVVKSLRLIIVEAHGKSSLVLLFAAQANLILVIAPILTCFLLTVRANFSLQRQLSLVGALA